MIRGNTILTKLQERRREIEAEKRSLSRAIVERDNRLSVLRRDEAVAWARFARAQLAEGTALPTAVQALIEERKRAFAKADNTVSNAETEIARLESELVSLRKTLAAEEAKLSNKEADVAAAIECDPRTAALNKDIGEIREKLAAMRQKLSRAEGDAQEKGLAYENDEFFTYLRDRGYGTDDYASTGLTRTLDRWLSDLIGYREAAADYERLKSIPAWVGERVRELEYRLVVMTAAMEEVRGDHESALDKFKADVRKARQEVENVELAIKAARLNEANAAKFLESVARGDDPSQQKIMQTLIERLSNEKRDALRRLAGSTRSAEDDLALTEIEEIARERLHLSSEADGMRTDLAAIDRRLNAVEDAEKKLKRKGWDRTSAEFDMTSRDKDDLVDRLAAGYIASDLFYREVSSAYDEPRKETTSSGGFGGSSNWGGSSSRTEDSGSTWSSGGGFGSGSDSWSTGGGFGGGSDDNKTGGGF